MRPQADGMFRSVEPARRSAHGVPASPTARVMRRCGGAACGGARMPSRIETRTDLVRKRLVSGRA